MAAYRIALDLADLERRDDIAEALDGHPALRLVAAADGPDLLITDAAPGGTEGVRMLRLEGGPLPPEAPVALVLAAAYLLAAGLEVSPAAANPGAGPPPRLTSREQDVLALLMEGAPNKVVARRLGISVSTAKFHVAAVLAKLGARNRAQAVARALRDGLAGI